VNPYRDLMHRLGEREGVDPLLLEAVSFQESSWRADAFRFEPAFYERYLKGKPQFKGQVPRRISSSYGLFQVMYSTALEHGFSDEPEVLFVPFTNILMGARILKSLLSWAGGDVAQALAAYNGGKGNWKAAIPGDYARRVLTHYTRLKGEA
jgi:hypothetical protein